MSTVAELLAAARRSLLEAGVDAPGREAALLLRSLLGMSEAALLARDRDPVPTTVETSYLRLVARRSRREPVAYLLGEREFFGRSFAVDARVLIPRPETELLVETALDLALPERARVLDVGTGSGCIALTLACERPSWSVVATDRSPAALAVADANRRRLGVGRQVRLVAADLLAGVNLSSFDLLVANLPYVAASEREKLASDVRDHEPAAALFADDDGFALVDALLGAARGLSGGAHLLAEIGAAHGSAAVTAARDRSVWSRFEVRRDLAGLDRLVVARRRGGGSG